MEAGTCRPRELFMIFIDLSKSRVNVCSRVQRFDRLNCALE